MEAIWVAAEMRAGAAFAHSALALDALGTEAETTRFGDRSELHGSATAEPRTEAKLDEALKATFPASDPFQISDTDRPSYASPPCFMHEVDAT
jgi:hypothetical protein